MLNIFIEYVSNLSTYFHLTFTDLITFLPLHELQNQTELSNHRSLWKWLNLSLISSKCSMIKQHVRLKDDTKNRCLSKNESTCTLQVPIPPDAVATMMSPVPSRAGQSAMILLADFHSQVKRQSAPEKILQFIIGQQKANIINKNMSIL